MTVDELMALADKYANAEAGRQAGLCTDDIRNERCAALRSALEQVVKGSDRMERALQEIALHFPRGEARRLYFSETETLDRIREIARSVRKATNANT